jgi:quercetin dioxygenase-like cupin family protein
MKYVIPAGHKLDWHHHVAMNHGVLVQGELTIIGLDGQTKTLHEGDVVVEMVDSAHYGENRGTKPVVLYMFYISQEGLPLSVPHPEIPMK